MGAVVQGQALGGIFAATSNVVMLACGADDVSAAFYNFLIAVIFLISALVAFIVLTRTEFFQYYADESPNETTVVNDDTSNEKLIGDNAGDNARVIPVRYFSIHSALKLEKSAISKVQKHIICIFKNGKKNQFLHQKKV